MTEQKKRRRLILAFVFLAFVLCVIGIITLAVHSKTRVAEAAIKSIRAMGGSVEVQDKYYSRGFLADTVKSVANAMGYETNLGHQAYTVHINETFKSLDLIQLNAIPHLRALHIDSPTLGDEIFGNLHASDLLLEFSLTRVQVTGNGLSKMLKYKNLRKLSLSSLDKIGNDDFEFIAFLPLDQLVLFDIEVNPLGFSEENKLPPQTQLLIERPRPIRPK
jgi:hypothetical protein